MPPLWASASTRPLTIGPWSRTGSVQELTKLWEAREVKARGNVQKSEAEDLQLGDGDGRARESWEKAQGGRLGSCSDFERSPPLSPLRAPRPACSSREVEAGLSRWWECSTAAPDTRAGPRGPPAHALSCQAGGHCLLPEPARGRGRGMQTVGGNDNTHCSD